MKHEDAIRKALDIAPRLRRIVHDGLAWPSAATLIEAADILDEMTRLCRTPTSSETAGGTE